MADVHIRKITRTAPSKGKAAMIYHFDLDNPKTGIFPTPISAIDSELNQAEKDALTGGTRVEVNRDMAILGSQSKQEIVAAIKADWLQVKANYNSKFNFEYKFFGDTIADASA